MAEEKDKLQEENLTGDNREDIPTTEGKADTAEKASAGDTAQDVNTAESVQESKEETKE